jgi:phosphoglycolate phosphatase
MAPRALVFDLDGTIWDTRPWLARLVGGGHASAERAATDALRGGANAAKLLRSARLQPQFGSLCSEALDLKPYPGVRKTLRALASAGVPLGVVTNLPGWMADPLLAGFSLDGYFGRVITYGSTQAHKPSAEPILACLKGLGVDPAADVWYVGDSLTDCQAAVRAGVSFAWAAYGYSASRPEGSSVEITRFSEVGRL